MFDSHAHVMFESFDGDRKAVEQRAQQAGVRGWLEVGTDMAQSRRAIQLAEQNPAIWAAVGVHPSDIEQLTAPDWVQIEKLLDHPRVVAVGEVGLDYHHDHDKAKQQKALRRFIDLAHQKDLPIVFHVRNGKENAHADLLDFLRHQAQPVKGVIHTYSGTWEQAEAYLVLGLYLSFSGVVTFKNGREVAAVAKAMPRNRLLIETDCPFLAPEPYRGKRNEPAYVALVAQKVAELRGLTLEEVGRVTDDNARSLFNLK